MSQFTKFIPNRLRSKDAQPSAKERPSVLRTPTTAPQKPDRRQTVQAASKRTLTGMATEPSPKRRPHIANSVEKELKYLSQTALLEESHTPRIIRATLQLVSMAILGFIAWAAVTDVNEIARADGDVVPDGYVQVVQHLEGGIVKAILIKEGDLVQKDDVMIQLGGGGAQEDLTQTQQRHMTLQLQAERLRAFLEDRTPDFTRYQAPASLVQEQQKIFAGMQAARHSEREVIHKQVAQRTETLAILKGDLSTAENNTTLAQESRDIQKKLLDKGLANRTHYLRNEKELNASQGRILALQSEIRQVEQERAEFKGRLRALNDQHRDSAYQELDQIEAAITQNGEHIKKLKNRVYRLAVRSPVTGYVKGLRINTVGGIVGSGETLMEIVPQEKQLVAEIRISPKDVGHIKIGQPVRIKVDSFDYTRYGSIDGHIAFISATTFVDEQQKSYYRGRVLLQEQYVGQSEQRNTVLPGMTVDADIVTGRKTILAYLLKPIHTAASTAFTER